MSRRGVEGLATPVTLASLLPNVYQHFDDNIVRLTEALDDVIAPVWTVLDCFDAYLDPALAPVDFVDMLARWVGLQVDRNWSDAQLRALVTQAVELYRWRGTVQGVSNLVEAYTGVVPVIEESGGCTVSDKPGGAPPGSPNPAARVTVQLPAEQAEDLARLTRLIADGIPAHVALNVEIVRL